MPLLPSLNDEEIAQQLRALKGQMSILSMERKSGVSRQVLYRIMGGTSINRSPYELVVKVLHFLHEHPADSPTISHSVETLLQVKASALSK